MAVYIYTRVSTLDQVEGSSLAEQSRKCQGAAMMAGHEVAATFTDAGISGGVALAERPEGGKLAAMLRPGDVVIVAKIDRCFRSAADALTTVQGWQAEGVSLVVAEFGAEPVNANGTAKLLFGILAMVAEFEKGLIKERMTMGRAAKKAKGGHIGGSAPFGFRKVGQGKGAMLEPIPAEQAAIADMRDWQAEGLSLRTIAGKVQEVHGLTLSHLSVRAALARAAG